MDYGTAHEITRLRRLIESAQAHRKHAIESGNTARAMRAARLEIAAHGKAMGIVMGEVRTYSDYD
jgi:hypothetical protein